MWLRAVWRICQMGWRAADLRMGDKGRGAAHGTAPGLRLACLRGSQRWGVTKTCPPRLGSALAACRQVGVGAFVLNERQEVLVVQEKLGPLRGKAVWKMPTGQCCCRGCFRWGG